MDNVVSDKNDEQAVNNLGRTEAQVGEPELKRELKPHQVFMFGIASAIGTGLVIGTGASLARGGPGSTMISYILVGAAVFWVMASLGEMAAYLPMNKGFSGYAGRMVDPALGFATGWNYFFKYIVTAPTNLTVSGLVIQYWRPDLHVAIWITILGAVVIASNLVHVKHFGEMQFWFSLAKVLIMATLIIGCLTIALGGGPKHEMLGFYYWQNPGAFATYLVDGNMGRFLGWWESMRKTCFAYTGTEVVGMTFGETPNPRKNIPRAVKQTFWRISVLYILSVLVLGMCVPYNSDKLIGALSESTNGAASPFVVAFSLAGINVFGDAINASLLIFTLSAASSDIYCSSRSLYGLAKDHQAPRLFAKASTAGNPIYCVIASSIFIALGYMNISESTSQIFDYLVSLVTVFAVLNWIAILISYLAFRKALKAQDVPLESLPYTGPLQPYGAYYALFISLLVIVFNGYEALIPRFKAVEFILKNVGTGIFILNYLGWKLYKETMSHDPLYVDLVTGRRQWQTETTDDQKWNENWWKALCEKLRLKR